MAGCLPTPSRHCSLAGTKLYCLTTEARVWERLDQGRYSKAQRPGVEPATYWSQLQLRPNPVCLRVMSSVDEKGMLSKPGDARPRKDQVHTKTSTTDGLITAYFIPLLSVLLSLIINETQIENLTLTAIKMTTSRARCTFQCQGDGWYLKIFYSP